ncbi:MAG: DUF58 domain-containing protein [Phycisphaerae bacterium]|nr:DUF58 domain-containing protein [Phycisphaerae bacterium]
MPATLHEYRKYLDPAVLARLTGLELRARHLVEGFVSGMHRSPYRGHSVEFAEHRKYCQGDDLRHLDWRVLARTDKHYVKQYDQETNLQLTFVVDCSASMSFRSPDSPLSKREYATALAAALAYLALRQSDAVGLAVFDDRVTRFVRHSNQPTHWKAIVAELEHAPTARTTRLRHALDEIAEQLERRHVIVLISDLFDEPDEILHGLRHLRYRRHEPIVYHVLDHAELTFPFQELTRFEGLEEGGHLLTQARAVRDGYLAELNAFIDDVRRRCRQQRVDYALFDTREPLDRALSVFLATRGDRTR